MSENEFSYVEVDKNLIVTASIRDVDLHMYDVRRAPFELYGMYRPEDEEWFVRMPEEAAASVSEGVLRLSKEPTGGRIRFSTNSPCVAIRAEMCAVGYGSHYPLMEAGAFDLYVDTPEGSHFERPFTPPYGMKEGYEQIIKFRTAEERFLTINFPVHARVKNVWVGVAPGSTLGKGLPYSNQKPVVFYGSSITHGTGTTRPGLTYSNRLSRRFNLNIYNLGFSGQCKGEPAMAEYLAGLDMAALVLDYDHNAPTPEYLEETHKALFDRIRQSHPALPVIMLTRPNVYPESVTAKRARDVIYKTYADAKAAGDENVYFVDGSEYMKPFGYDDGILDGVHPNDLGYHAMVEAICPHMAQIVAKSKDFQK